MRNSFNPEGFSWAERRRQKNHQRALTFLSLTIFVLMAFPRLRISFGQVPLYIIDVFILITAYFTAQIKLVRSMPLKSLVTFILGTIFVSEIIGGLQMRTLLIPIYWAIRTLLAGYLFFLPYKIIQRKEDIERVIKAILLGALITATLLILTSIPQTRGITNHVFSLEFLEPSTESVVDRLGSYIGASRGRSLIGISNISGAFLNGMWPLILLLHKYQERKFWWHVLFTLAIFIIPISVVMTYSRGAILGILLSITTMIFLNVKKVRRYVVLGVGFAVSLFYWVGWESNYFFFERLITSTQRTIEDPYTEYERLLTLTQPFQHVVRNPRFLFFGQGFARQHVSGQDLSLFSQAATHSVFAASYYSYGLLAALAYVFLIFGGIRLSLVYRLGSGKSFSSGYSGALLMGLISLLPWFFLAHGAVIHPRGAEFFFLYFGLVASQSNFYKIQTVDPNRKKPKH